MEKKPITIGYWNIRGKGHIVRMLLQYLHIPYQDVIYSSPQSFFNQEKQIAHMANNLPYVKDGNTTVYDLIPTFIYISRKYEKQEIMGKTMKDQTTIDMFHWDVQYLFMKLICSSYYNLSEQERHRLQNKILKENVEPVLTKFQNRILDQNKWCLGYLSFIDFCIYQLTFYISFLFPDKMKQFPKIVNISKNVGQIPEIKELQKQQKIKQLCSTPKQMCRNSHKFRC